MLSVESAPEIDTVDAIAKEGIADSRQEPQTRTKKASIKLGLGDFVFYSVLVSRAAMFGFVTFVASFVAIIAVSFCVMVTRH